MKKTAPLNEASSGECGAGVWTAQVVAIWQSSYAEGGYVTQSNDVPAVQLHAGSLQDKKHHFELPYSALIRLVTSLAH